MFKKWSVRPRSLLSILSAALVGVILPADLHWASRTLCIWDTGMICFLALTCGQWCELHLQLCVALLGSKTAGEL